MEPRGGLGASAREVPDRVAVVCGDRTVSWRDFDDRAGRLASWLYEQGVRPGDRVALDLTNVPEYLEAFFATLKLGAAPLNVNYRYVADEVRYVLENSGAVACVHAPEFGDIAAEAVARLDADAATRVARHRRAVRGRALRGRARRSVVGPRAARRRPHPALHRRHHGPAQRRDVAQRRSLSRACGCRAGPSTEPTDPVAAARAGKRAGIALPACPLMHGTGLFIALSTLSGASTVVLIEEPGLDPERGLVRGRAQRALPCSPSSATCSRGRCSPYSKPRRASTTCRRCGDHVVGRHLLARCQGRAHAAPAGGHDHRLASGPRRES